MKKIAIAILLLVLATPSLAFDKWSKQDYALEATKTALLVLDWGQTRNISKKPKYFAESNPLLGTHPSTVAVNNYFISTILISTAITYILPSKYRPYWQMFFIGMETTCVGTNYKAGVKIDF